MHLGHTTMLINAVSMHASNYCKSTAGIRLGYRFLRIVTLFPCNYLNNRQWHWAREMNFTGSFAPGTGETRSHHVYGANACLPAYTGCAGAGRLSHDSLHEKSRELTPVWSLSKSGSQRPQCSDAGTSVAALRAVEPCVCVYVWKAVGVAA